MNNIITVYNNNSTSASSDAVITAHITRNMSRLPFMVTDIKVFDAFPLRTNNQSMIEEPETLKYIQIVDTITNDDNNYKHSTFKSANIECDAEFNICTYRDGTSSASPDFSSVGRTITMGETIQQLNMRIIVPGAVIDACTRTNVDQVFTVVVTLDRCLSEEEGRRPTPLRALMSPDELMRRTNARSAKGYIIIDSFGGISFTWSNG